MPHLFPYKPLNDNPINRVNLWDIYGSTELPHLVPSKSLKGKPINSVNVLPLLITVYKQ
jgi:hypothetical protein